MVSHKCSVVGSQVFQPSFFFIVLLNQKKLGDPSCNKHDKMSLFARLKQILIRRFRAALYFLKIKSFFLCYILTLKTRLYRKSYFPVRKITYIPYSLLLSISPHDETKIDS